MTPAFGRPPARVLRTVYDDRGPDAEGKRSFTLEFIDEAGRVRAQCFRSAQWQGWEPLAQKVGDRVRFLPGTPADGMTFRQGLGTIAEPVQPHETAYRQGARWWVRPDGHEFVWPVEPAQVGPCAQGAE